MDGVGKLKVPGIVPKLSETPGEIEWSGPNLGKHTTEILTQCGISSDELKELARRGIIYLGDKGR